VPRKSQPRVARALSPRARGGTVRRGRPPKSAAEIEASRRVLLSATRAVFARHGFHGSSVELVVEEAGVSRPTFYKHFCSLHEALEVVLSEVNADLLQRVMRGVDAASTTVQKAEAALIAYRDWGAQLGPLLRALFGELHDPHSPTSQHRQRTLNKLSSKFIATAKKLGRPSPSRLVIDTMFNAVEYLGYRYHLESRRTEASWRATRAAMLRIALGLLSSESQLSAALPIARSLDLDLGARDVG
jgi:AcrR family transcriptional regulator